MNITQLKESLPFLIKANLVPNIIGKHGIGKSSVVAQYAKENGYSFHPFFLGQMNDTGDLLGLPEFDRDANGKAISTSFIHPAKLPKKPRSILFFDELNRASKELLQAIFQLALEGTIHDYKLPEDSAIIMAMNPATDDYSVLDFSDKAFLDRFVHINLDPTHEEFHAYMSNRYNNNSPISDFLRQQTELLEENDLKAISLEFVKPSRRSWDRLQKLEQTGMPDVLFREAGMGIVGTVAMLAYSSFKESRVKVLKGTDILNNYDEVRNTFLGYFKDVEKPRNDIVSSVLSSFSDELTALLKDNAVTEKHAQNCITFLLDAPVENVFATLLTLSKNVREFGINKNLRKHVLDNAELEAKLIEGKKAKAKYAEEQEKRENKFAADDIPF
jgi:hypothetical protein